MGLGEREAGEGLEDEMLILSEEDKGLRLSCRPHFAPHRPEVAEMQSLEAPPLRTGTRVRRGPQSSMKLWGLFTISASHPGTQVHDTSDHLFPLTSIFFPSFFIF